MDVILIAMVVLLAIMSIIVGIWKSFIYIKLSWIKRDNEKGYNGIEVAKKVLEKNGKGDIEVRSNFWSLTYVNYSSRKKRLKIGKIDSKRKSIWTVGTSGRQAYSAHMIEESARGNKTPISIIWFKLQTYWFSVFFSIAFDVMIIISFSLWIDGFVVNENVFNVWFFVFILVLVFFPLMISMAAFKTSRLMMKDIHKIFGDIIPENEINKIKKLWRLEYISAIIDLIKTILIIFILILKIIAKSQSTSN